MAKMLYATVAEGGPVTPRQFVGLPPELTGGVDHRQVMPRARVLIISEEGGAFFLFRYSKDGDFAGDTWHQTIQDAFDQAIFEYGEDLLSEWNPIPPDAADPVHYVLERVGDSQV